VVLVFDVAEPLPEILRKFRASREVLAKYPVKVVAALNKADLIPREELERKLKTLNDVTMFAIPISALKHTNLSSLIEIIRTNVSGSREPA